MIPEGEKNINYSESLDFCCEIYMVGSKSGVKKHDPSHTVSTVQAAADGAITWRVTSCHALGTFLPHEHSLNSKPTWVLLLTTPIPVWPSSDGYFKPENATRHKDSIVSNCFTVLKVTRSQSNRAHLGCGEKKSPIMDVQHKIWRCLLNINQNLGGRFPSVPRRIQADLKAKEGLTQH